jgi:hypothetical protein
MHAQQCSKFLKVATTLVNEQCELHCVESMHSQGEKCRKYHSYFKCTTTVMTF